MGVVPLQQRPPKVVGALRSGREALMLFVYGIATGVALTVGGIYAGLAWRLKTMWK